ncbi:MAG: hypothetical protein AAFX99_31185, partial [Myxococcota bacterium]
TNVYRDAARVPFHLPTPALKKSGWQPLGFQERLSVNTLIQMRRLSGVTGEEPEQHRGTHLSYVGYLHRRRRVSSYNLTAVGPASEVAWSRAAEYVDLGRAQLRTGCIPRSS